jgi:hypothetical protein
VAYPIATDDLTVLAEQVTSDFDLGADLSQEGADVEGMTEFLHNAKPRVRIARELSDDPRRENRLRTTVAHELGHVKFHNFQWEQPGLAQPRLFGEVSSSVSLRCRRENIIGAKEVDWMEWQAGYASGALLMPYTSLRQLVQKFVDTHDLPSRSRPDASQHLLTQVQSCFQVSQDAARVRLSQLNWLNLAGSPSLF